MATYAIGDIQGCFYSFQNLLKVLNFNKKKDKLWLVGDLVNRGRWSLEVLNWCFENKEVIKAVLGNHDLHLLAILTKKQFLNSSDTLQPILMAQNLSKLVEWLYSLPLIQIENNFLMVHAGLLPEWSSRDAKDLSDMTMMALNKNPGNFFEEMYGNNPKKWDSNLKEKDLLRLTINIMTRMRVLDKNGAINFSYKDNLTNLPNDLRPWFELRPKKRSEFIISGHWSAIGVVRHDNGITLDSGCVWGGELSAYDLYSKKIIKVNADLRDLI